MEVDRRQTSISGRVQLKGTILVKGKSCAVIKAYRPPITSRVEGTDRTLVFRVRYELQGIDLYEYRYRLCVANALSNLIISARATAGGSEPADLPMKAQAIAARQVARLVAARQ